MRNTVHTWTQKCRDRYWLTKKSIVLKWKSYSQKFNSNINNINIPLFKIIPFYTRTNSTTASCNGTTTHSQCTTLCAQPQLAKAEANTSQWGISKFATRLRFVDNDDSYLLKTFSFRKWSCPCLLKFSTSSRHFARIHLSSNSKPNDFCVVSTVNPSHISIGLFWRQLRMRLDIWSSILVNRQGNKQTTGTNRGRVIVSKSIWPTVFVLQKGRLHREFPTISVRLTLFNNLSRTNLCFRMSHIAFLRWNLDLEL